MRLRALWWWIDRWRKSTAYTDMTLEEQGAYRNLLDEATLRNGPIPNDERVLAKACGDAQRWRKVRTTVLAHFTLTADGWRNETLDSILRESERRADKQRKYRSSSGNESGNGAGNEHGNEVGNRDGNKAGNKIGNAARPPDPDPDLKNVQKQEQIQEKKEREIRASRVGLRTGLLKPNGNVAFEGPKIFMPWDVYYKLSKLRNNEHADAELRTLFDRVSAEWSDGGRHAQDEPGANMFRFWDARYDEQWPPTATPKVEAKPRSSAASEARMKALLGEGPGR